MDWLHLLQVFVAGALWRLTGVSSAGRVLTRALAFEDENVRVIAGMFLVKGGSRALPLLRETLTNRKTLASVLTMLGDIGDRGAIADVQRFIGDPDAPVAKAAQAALKLLEQAHGTDAN
jgi:HEAT repeat protein